MSLQKTSQDHNANLLFLTTLVCLAQSAHSNEPWGNLGDEHYIALNYSTNVLYYNLINMNATIRRCTKQYNKLLKVYIYFFNIQGSKTTKTSIWTTIWIYLCIHSIKTPICGIVCLPYLWYSQCYICWWKPICHLQILKHWHYY